VVPEAIFHLKNTPIMDTASLIIALVFLALFIVPVVYLNKKKK
jgi:hypothetical protein